MFEAKKNRQHYYMRHQILSEVGKDATVGDVLSHLLGGVDGSRSDYVVYKYVYTKRTALNRINMIWVAPLFICALPMQWLFTGRTGLSRDSRLGEIVERLVKFD